MNVREQIIKNLEENEDCEEQNLYSLENEKLADLYSIYSSCNTCLIKTHCDALNLKEEDITCKDAIFFALACEQANTINLKDFLNTAINSYQNIQLIEKDNILYKGTILNLPMEYLSYMISGFFIDFNTKELIIRTT